MVGLSNDWVQWMFDDAVATLGRMVENKLAERDSKGETKWSIEDVLEGRAFQSRLSSMIGLALMSDNEVVDF